MKAAIVGTGHVGRAAAEAMVHRGSAREIVLVDERAAVADAIALDLRHGSPVSSPRVAVRSGGMEDLAGCGIVVIDAGTNERDGGATDRADPQGRLRLLDANVPVIEAIVPAAVAAAPDAVLLVVTNPPDPLADLARGLAGHGRVMSSGTLLDSSRFRAHLAEALGVAPASVQANVLGEHGTSAVLHWSGASAGGVALADVLDRRGLELDELKARVERAVRGANLDIIAGIGASQYGIGAVTARLVEAVLRDERLVAPVGSLQPREGLTFSRPSVVGRGGVLEVLEPALDGGEREALGRSVAALRAAAQRMSGLRGPRGAPS